MANAKLTDSGAHGHADLELGHAPLFGSEPGSALFAPLAPKPLQTQLLVQAYGTNQKHQTTEND